MIGSDCHYLRCSFDVGGFVFNHQDVETLNLLHGATPEGKKELIGFQTGVRKRAQSWRELLIDIKQRGSRSRRTSRVGDGALDFWRAIEEAFPSTRHQRWFTRRPTC